MPFDPKLVEAKLALGLIGSDEMPALAWDAMEAGLDGMSIRRLAALERPSGWEVDQLRAGFMADSGLKSISVEETALRVARPLAERILRENLDPLDYAREFELLYFRADYPKSLQAVGCMEDDGWVAKYMGKSEAEVREDARRALRALMDAGRTGERA